MNKLRKPNPWDRQPEESERDYMAFQVYLEMDKPRVLKQAFAVFSGKAPNEAGAYLYEISAKREWRNRVYAYDLWYAAQMDSIKVEVLKEKHLEVERQRVEVNHSALDLAQLLVNKAKVILSIPVVEQVIDLHDGKPVTIIKPMASVRYTDAIKMIELSDKLQRLSTDMATEKVKIEIGAAIASVCDDAGVSPAEIAEEYERLFGEALTVGEGVQLLPGVDDDS